MKYIERKLFLPASSPPLDYFQAPIHFSAWVSSAVPGSTTCAKSSIVGAKSDIIVWANIKNFAKVISYYFKGGFRIFYGGFVGFAFVSPEIEMWWNMRLLLLTNISAVLASVTEMTDKIAKVGSYLSVQKSEPRLSLPFGLPS